MLRDVLVDQLGQEKVSEDLCAVTNAIEPEDGSILVIKSRVCPINKADIRAIPSSEVGACNVWISSIRRCVLGDLFPQIEISDNLIPRIAYILALVVLMASVAHLHTFHVVQYSLISPWFVLGSELAPPLANEFAVSLGAIIVSLGTYKWGKWLVLFLLCSFPMDIIGAAVTGQIASHFADIVIKVSTCILVNKFSAAIYRH